VGVHCPFLKSHNGMTRALVKKTRGFANWDQNFQIYFSKMLATNKISHTVSGDRLGALLTGKTGGVKLGG